MSLISTVVTVCPTQNDFGHSFHADFTEKRDCTAGQLQMYGGNIAWMRGTISVTVHGTLFFLLGVNKVLLHPHRKNIQTMTRVVSGSEALSERRYEQDFNI